MKLRDLRHGRGDVASSWPPGFGGEYAAGDKFPIGEVGKLTNVEPSERVPGVTVDIARSHYARHLWRSPSGLTGTVEFMRMRFLAVASVVFALCSRLG